MTANAAEIEALTLRCESATGADRELDADIAPLQGLRIVDEGHPLGRCCYDGNGQSVTLPRYTASLDAAMSLVPEEYCVDLMSHEEGWDARIGSPAYARAATPALALTAAALRARASEITDQPQQHGEG